MSVCRRCEVFPSVSQLARMFPLSRLVGRLQGEWLEVVLREERLVAYFQPIVECDSTQQ